MQPKPHCPPLGLLGSVMVMSGIPRLTWFRKLTNETSTRSLARSLRLKLLAKAKSQLMVPGPSRMPTPEVPKRPIGGGVVPPEPSEHAVVEITLAPGQTKPEEANHWPAFWVPE